MIYLDKQDKEILERGFQNARELRQMVSPPDTSLQYVKLQAYRLAELDTCL